MSYLDRLPRRPLLALAFTMFAALPLACSNSISSGGGGSGGGGGGGGSCDPGCPPPHPTTGPLAIALLASQMPFDEGGGGSGGSATSGVGGGGPGLDPNMLFVQIGNNAQICSDPFASQDCGSQWRVTIGIPPSLQVPGVISLSHPEIIASFSDTGPIEQNVSECWAGGGSFSDGTIEIVSIDATFMVVRLANTESFDFAADGEYDVERCFTQ